MGVFGYVCVYWKWDTSFWGSRVLVNVEKDNSPRTGFSFCSRPLALFFFASIMRKIWWWLSLTFTYKQMSVEYSTRWYTRLNLICSLLNINNFIMFKLFKKKVALITFMIHLDCFLKAFIIKAVQFINVVFHLVKETWCRENTECYTLDCVYFTNCCDTM